MDLYFLKNQNSLFRHLKNEPQLREKIFEKVNLGGLSGGSSLRRVSNLRVSPIWLVSKTDGDWRLVTHFAFPSWDSVDDFIKGKMCSVKYTSLESIQKVMHRTSCHHGNTKTIGLIFKAVRFNNYHRGYFDRRHIVTMVAEFNLPSYIHLWFSLSVFVWNG